jgi:alkylhydroperoxidase/carboxymuconolactone decarboxylase family protein YurZ
MAEHEERLRRLALGDETFIESLIALGPESSEVSRLDPKTHALVRLGALLGAGAAPVSQHHGVAMALATGASAEEIVGTLVAVASIIGTARVVSAAPELAVPIGYDIDAALEELNGGP